jgi:hypothetical protein
VPLIYSSLTLAFSTIENGVPTLPDTLKQLVPAAHAADTKVLLSIGGWGGGDGFHPSFNNSAGRAKFVNATKKLIDDTGIDGIDIDWVSRIDIEFVTCLEPWNLSQSLILATTGIPRRAWSLRTGVFLGRYQEFFDGAT